MDANREGDYQKKPGSRGGGRYDRIHGSSNLIGGNRATTSMHVKRGGIFEYQA